MLFPQRWTGILLFPLTATMDWIESLYMRYYRAALSAQTKRERLDSLGYCDTFNFNRHHARREHF